MILFPFAATVSVFRNSEIEEHRRKKKKRDFSVVFARTAAYLRLDERSRP